MVCAFFIRYRLYFAICLGKSRSSNPGSPTKRLSLRVVFLCGWRWTWLVVARCAIAIRIGTPEKGWCYTYKVIKRLGGLGRLGTLGTLEKSPLSPLSPLSPQHSCRLAQAKQIQTLRVYLYLPLWPFRPLLPLQRSCRLEQAKQTQTLRAAHPNFLSEGVRCNARQKCHRWVVLGVRPIGGTFC